MTAPGASGPAAIDAAVDWAEAREIARGAASALRSESVIIDAAVGRTLAVDVRAPFDLPHYASSAMDGWVVSGEGAWRLVDHDPQEGEARAIVTGGLVPAGATAVLRSEHGAIDDSGMLRTNDRATPGEPAAGQHIRAVGAEARSGTVLVEAGAVLNPASVAVAASCGLDELEVRAVPRVALVLTGDEVVESGVPTPGAVRDSFGPTLPAFVRMLGGEVGSTARAADDAEALTRAIRSSGDLDLVVTTGGTGGSAVDHLRGALAALNASILIERVSMRPGGPTLLARLPGGCLLLGLPGNPLAAMLGLLSIGEPVISALLGRGPEASASIAVAQDIAPTGHRTLVPFTRVDGLAVATGWRGSGMLRGLAAAHGVLVCPPEGVQAGGVADVLALPW